VQTIHVQHEDGPGMLFPRHNRRIKIGVVAESRA
jgi:hypothetical protein